MVEHKCPRCGYELEDELTRLTRKFIKLNETFAPITGYDGSWSE